MSLKVLLTDDDKMAVFLQRLIIVESGLAENVLSFSDGLETLNYLNENDEPASEYLLFLDINMPVMNGWDLLAEVVNKPFANRLHIVMASSYSEIKDKEALARFPQIIHIFEKPITLEICRKVMSLPSITKYFS